jgi:hypothetical protein
VTYGLHTPYHCGRFILGCWHLLILRAANMPAKFGGERYAYPMLMAAGACIAYHVLSCLHVLCHA